MGHSRGEDEEEEEFPTFGDSESDYDTVSQPQTLNSCQVFSNSGELRE